jgi:hypothetical protein
MGRRRSSRNDLCSNRLMSSGSQPNVRLRYKVSCSVSLFPSSRYDLDHVHVGRSAETLLYASCVQSGFFLKVSSLLDRHLEVFLQLVDGKLTDDNQSIGIITWPRINGSPVVCVAIYSRRNEAAMDKCPVYYHIIGWCKAWSANKASIL